MPTMPWAGVLFYLYQPGLSRHLDDVRLRQDDALTYLARWDDEFRLGRPCAMYQYSGGWDPNTEQDRFVDLRPHVPPRCRLGPRVAVLDWYARAITYNADALQELGLQPPFRTWSDFLRTLARCRRAGYHWPIAMPNHESTPWAAGWWDHIADRCLRSRFPDPAALRRAILSGRWHVRDPDYVAAARLFRRLARYFIWYCNTYTSIQTKPFYFSRRPQCLFRPGDYRRLRLDHTRHAEGRFPFREEAMPIPETDRGLWGPSLTIAITRGPHASRALKILARLLSARSQRLLVRWGNTRPAVAGIPPAPAVASIPFRPRQILVTYRGLSPEAHRIWFRGLQALIEPDGGLAPFLRAADHALAIDRRGP